MTMRPRILAGLGAAGALAFGVFAATGFGNGGGAPAEIATKTVETHAVAEPPDGVTAAAKRGGLFKITYRSTDPQAMPSGYSTITLKSCPRNGAVLNGWDIRTGATKTGVFSAGGTPDGLRRWQIVIDNTAGAGTEVKF